MHKQTIQVDKEKYKNAVYSNEKSLKKAIPFGKPSGISGVIDIVKLIRKFSKGIKAYSEDTTISVESLENNPESPKEIADKGFVETFEAYCDKLGIANIGYTKVSPELVLQRKVALYPNVIVLTMEMDKEKIDKSPSQETYDMIHETYSQFNENVNELADFIRQHGYGAQTGLSAGGNMVSSYPWLAEKAGLGYRGRSGNLITPKLGPRLRLAVIFTSINNLNFYEENTHEWIWDFCAKCNLCIKKCPGDAIIPPSEMDKHLNYKHLDAGKCSINHGCADCIKVCPFNFTPYEKIKSSFLKRTVVSPN